MESGFDNWPRIKPRFGVQNLFQNRSFNAVGDGGGGGGGFGPMVDNRGSPIRESLASKKRELSSPGSPDLFKTPSKKRKIDSRDPSSSSRGGGGGGGAASGLLWGTDLSPLKTTPKKKGSSPTRNSPLKPPISPSSGNFVSPSKRLVGFGSPCRDSSRGYRELHGLSPHPNGLSPHPSGMNSLSKTPTKSPSIASILHLVTSPIKGNGGKRGMTDERKQGEKGNDC